MDKYAAFRFIKNFISKIPAGVGSKIPAGAKHPAVIGGASLLGGALLGNVAYNKRVDSAVAEREGYNDAMRVLAQYHSQLGK